jgi:hypothetical protein
VDCAQQCGAHAIFTASSVLNWDNQTFWNLSSGFFPDAGNYLGCVNPHSLHSLSQLHIADVALLGSGNPS